MAVEFIRVYTVVVHSNIYSTLRCTRAKGAVTKGTAVVGTSVYTRCYERTEALTPPLSCLVGNLSGEVKPPFESESYSFY